jgi:hypothetical protein
VTSEYILQQCQQLRDEQGFNDLALEIFRFQAKEIDVYKDFLDLLKVQPGHITHYREIPFLPIEFFKNHRIISPSLPEQLVFKSSGTTGSIRSTHFIHSSELYAGLSRSAFSMFYGDPEEWTFLALLPSYLERSDSSLVHMISEFMKASPGRNHGFFLNDPIALKRQLELCDVSGEKVLLIGVTFALLDLAELDYRLSDSAVIMETGGMKGRREELTREEVHLRLKKGFSKTEIHSEYGMTELISQAYATSEGHFRCPPWMKTLIREVNDPFSYCEDRRTGGINCIDLGNAFSCSFIATQDLGRVLSDGSFEVLGRFDHSDVRGCNLLVAN